MNPTDPPPPDHAPTDHAPTDPPPTGPPPTDPAPTERAGSDDDPGETALLAALVELDRHVGVAGWEQPPRLFALVRTVELQRAEPSLGLTATDEHGLTAVEQEDFVPGDDLVEDLAGIEWPAQVSGCAVSAVRSFLTAEHEDSIPAGPDAAAFVAGHPDRQDIRVVLGVDRAGHRHGVARLAQHPDDLLSGSDLVPGLLAALAHTLN